MDFFPEAPQGGVGVEDCGRKFREVRLRKPPPTLTTLGFEGGRRSARQGLSQPDETGLVDQFPEIFWEVFFLEEAATQFGQGGILDLADSFAGYLQFFAHFLKGSFLVVSETKPQSENFKFTCAQNRHAP